MEWRWDSQKHRDHRDPVSLAEPWKVWDLQIPGTVQGETETLAENNGDSLKDSLWEKALLFAQPYLSHLLPHSHTALRTLAGDQRLLWGT